MKLFFNIFTFTEIVALTLLPAIYFQNYLPQGGGGAIIIHPKISCIGYIFAY